MVYPLPHLPFFTDGEQVRESRGIRPPGAAQDQERTAASQKLCSDRIWSCIDTQGYGRPFLTAVLALPVHVLRFEGFPCRLPLVSLVRRPHPP